MHPCLCLHPQDMGRATFFSGSRLTRDRRYSCNSCLHLCRCLRSHSGQRPRSLCPCSIPCLPFPSLLLAFKPLPLLLLHHTQQHRQGLTGTPDRSAVDHADRHV